ncbi:hypothetical protein FRC07_010719 [Ceratobasidium sp. 392]|nr:hypothetical protein FRC07_010719 [Ceratobasidium sp. 392]
MHLSFASLLSAVTLALPLAALAAPALPIPNLEARTYGTHKVTVGAWGKLRYEPECVRAKPPEEPYRDGELVRQSVHEANRRPRQTDRLPYWLRPRARGIDVVLPESQTKPHWFYCGQVGHCPAGMVFAVRRVCLPNRAIKLTQQCQIRTVNPPEEGNTFNNFQKLATEFWS